MLSLLSHKFDLIQEFSNHCALEWLFGSVAASRPP